MKVVSIAQAKAHLADYIEHCDKDGAVIITR
jgi:hypothetical protein